METLIGKRKYKKWDSCESRAPRKSFRVPQVRQPCSSAIARRDIANTRSVQVTEQPDAPLSLIHGL
jgi:hypothetical protein